MGVQDHAESIAALAGFYAAHNERLFERLGEAPAEWPDARGAGR